MQHGGTVRLAEITVIDSSNELRPGHLQGFTITVTYLSLRGGRGWADRGCHWDASLTEEDWCSELADAVSAIMLAFTFRESLFLHVGLNLGDFTRNHLFAHVWR